MLQQITISRVTAFIIQSLFNVPLITLMKWDEAIPGTLQYLLITLFKMFNISFVWLCLAAKASPQPSNMSLNIRLQWRNNNPKLILKHTKAKLLEKGHYLNQCHEKKRIKYTVNNFIFINILLVRPFALYLVKRSSEWLLILCSCSRVHSQDPWTVNATFYPLSFSFMS